MLEVAETKSLGEKALGAFKIYVRTHFDIFDFSNLLECVIF